MAVESIARNNALVWRDDVYTQRWYDAVGAGVVKWVNDGFTHWPNDDSTGDGTEWQLTITEGGAGGDTTHVTTDRAGGALLITTDNQENDGINMQLGMAAGENVKLDGLYPLYCGIKFKINDVDQTDIYFGVGVTDTDWSGGVADAMYFYSADESSTLYFTTEKDSVPSSTAVGTLADDTYIVCEFLYDVDGYVRAYVNGTEMTSTHRSAATFPDDEEMRFTLEFLTGEAVADTCTVAWMRMIHVRSHDD